MKALHPRGTCFTSTIMLFAVFAFSNLHAQSPATPPGDVHDQDPGTVIETRTVLGLPLPSALAVSQQPSQTQSSGEPGDSPLLQAPASPHRAEAEKQYLKGAKALDKQDTREAVKDFSRAVELDQHNQRYIMARAIARQHLVNLLVEEGGKARMMGHSDVERAKLAEALAIDPGNSIATQHVDELASEALNPLDEGRNQASGSIAPPIEIAPAASRKSFHVRTSANSLLQQLASAYGIDTVLDESVPSKICRLDVDNASYAQAAHMVELVTGTFFVPLDPKRVLIAADTKLNRDKFQRLSEETVYLPGLSPAEMVDVGNLARNLFDAPSTTVMQQRGYMVLRAPAGRVKALNAVLSELLEGHSQVELEIRAFEVDTSRVRNIGIQLPQQTTFFNVDSEINAVLANNQALVDQIIASGLASANDPIKILLLLIASGQVSSSILAQPFAVFGGGLSLTGIVPGSVTGNLSLNSSDVRSLDDLNLRIVDQQDATFRAGTRYPIVTSTTTSTTASIPGVTTAGISSTLAGLGINASALAGLTQSTIPQIQYEDLGLTLKATPHVQLDKEVTLKLDLKIEALGTASLDSIPVLNNREFSAVITVPDGNTVMMVSNLNRQEAKAVSGLPGLSELPGFGSATDRTTNFDISKLVVTVTTHVIRQSHGSAVGHMVMLPIHD